jgi:uncharacterized protein DUF5655
MTRAMWRCPICGQTFTGRNMPHSCQVVPLDDHFAGKPPHLRTIFDALVAAAEANGPVVVNATKSRITLQAEMRFAAVETRQDHLRAHVVLGRRREDPRFTKVEHLPPSYYVHHFRLARVEDVDDDVRAWLAEAYLRRSRSPADPPAPDPPTPGSR